MDEKTKKLLQDILHASIKETVKSLKENEPGNIENVKYNNDSIIKASASIRINSLLEIHPPSGTISKYQQSLGTLHSTSSVSFSLPVILNAFNYIVIIKHITRIMAVFILIYLMFIFFILNSPRTPYLLC